VPGMRERLAEDMKAAMRGKEELRLATIRMIRAEILNKDKEHGKEAAEEDILKVLQSMIKRREEAAGQFAKGGRPELAAKERDELRIVQSYLPAQLGDEELREVRDDGSAAVAGLLPELAEDLRSYRVATPEPLEIDACGYRILSMPKPSIGGAVVERVLELLDAAGEPTLEDEARAIADAYGSSGLGPLTGTTHVSVIDASGMAAALSSTLGSGSGIFRGGTQLNNMLGELDVIGPGEHLPGERLASMMTPTLVLEEGRPRLVIGSAGSVRLAGAIAQVTWRILQGAHVSDAIHAPRVHVEGSTVHLEGGWPDADVAALPADWDVVRWEGINLFFGGVQAVERTADGELLSAGDPRRGGVGVVVE